MKNLTDDLRLQIVTLRNHTFKSSREIADDLNLSKSAVGRVLLSYQRTGNHYSARSSCGATGLPVLRKTDVFFAWVRKNPMPVQCSCRVNFQRWVYRYVKNGTESPSKNRKTCFQTHLLSVTDWWNEDKTTSVGWRTQSLDFWDVGVGELKMSISDYEEL